LFICQLRGWIRALPERYSANLRRDARRTNSQTDLWRKAVTKSTLDIAVDEAKRFIRKAGLVKVTLHGEYKSLEGPKETGAVRRASLDLTRALAEMRKP
jgi:hypothetical protein